MATQPPRVSVVAVSYNHEKWIHQTLESIASQTFKDIEVIYCDDASSDKSASLGAEWLRGHSIPFRLVLHKENQGLCKTLNEALSVANGEFLQIIACDDILLPNKLQRQVLMFEAAEDSVSTVYSDAFLINEVGRLMPGMFMRRHKASMINAPQGDVFISLLSGNFIPAMSTLTRRNAIANVGQFDESLRFEDHDMWLRLSRRYHFTFDPKPSALYRIHSQNLHKTLRSYRDEYWVIRKHIDIAEARKALIVMAGGWFEDEEAIHSEAMSDLVSILGSNLEMKNAILELCSLRPCWLSGDGYDVLGLIKLAALNRELCHITSHPGYRFGVTIFHAFNRFYSFLRHILRSVWRIFV